MIRYKLYQYKNEANEKAYGRQGDGYRDNGGGHGRQGYNSRRDDYGTREHGRRNDSEEKDAE